MSGSGDATSVGARCRRADALVRAISRLMDRGKSVASVARTLRVSRSLVSRIAAERGLRARRIRSRSMAYWARIDWSRTNGEIAKSEGTSLQTVMNVRVALRKAGYRIPLPSRGPGKPPRWTPETVSKIDWRRPNEALAKDLKMAAEVVSSLRSKLRRRGFDIPPAPQKGKR